MAQRVNTGPEQVIRWKREWAREGWGARPDSGKLKVFFMGDSKVSSGIIPALFDRHARRPTESYNYSLPGMPFAPHYFMLKDYLARGHDKPDFIILKFDPGGLHTPEFSFRMYWGAGPIEIAHYVLTTKSASVLARYFFPSRFNLSIVKRYFAGKILRLMPPRARALHRQDFIRKNRAQESFPHRWDLIYQNRYAASQAAVLRKRDLLQKNRGYYFFEEDSVAEGHVIKAAPAAATVTPAREDAFIESFARLTEAHGIQVILIPPYIMEGQAFPQGEAQKWMAKLSRRYKNFHHAGIPLVRYPAEMFSDPMHLNPEGARLFTRFAAGLFNRRVAAS